MNSVQHKTPRDSYHHGDLANALTLAATQLAREGGPEAVVLREAARKVGVSATAAYRHFAGHGDLIHAVKEQAQQALATSMRAELAKSEPRDEPADEALRRLRAIGAAYLGFALAEPGLFRTAFCRSDSKGFDEQSAGMIASPAFQLLSESLDALVTAGLLPADQRPYAEVFAWASPHGLAMLMLDGPLNQLPAQEREAAMDRVLDGVIHGLIWPNHPLPQTGVTCSDTG
jgi:AcrR family transcriptional regulator